MHSIVKRHDQCYVIFTSSQHNIFLTECKLYNIVHGTRPTQSNRKTKERKKSSNEVDTVTVDAFADNTQHKTIR